MEQYISKSALVAEIERRLEALSNTSAEDNREFAAIIGAQHYELMKLVQYIDTLEVKEVDLEKEIENLIEKEKAFVTDNREVKYYNGDSFNHIYELEFIAKHFFELGLKAQDAGEYNIELEVTHCDEMDRVSEFKKMFDKVNTYDSPLV